MTVGSSPHRKSQSTHLILDSLPPPVPLTASPSCPPQDRKPAPPPLLASTTKDDNAHVQREHPHTAPSTPLPTPQQARAWRRVRSRLRSTSGDAFRYLLSPLRLSHIDNGTVELLHPRLDTAAWIQEQFGPQLKQLWHNELGGIAGLRVVHDPALFAQAPNPQRASDQPRSVSQNTATSSPYSMPHDSRYTFDLFLHGPNNAIAYTAAKRLTEVVRERSTPLPFQLLVVQGNVGDGKTHLLRAIHHELCQSDCAVRAAYLPAERFVSGFMQALTHQTLEPFKAFYRNLDVLLLDDFHIFVGKRRSQEELMFTINELLNHRGFVVLATDRPPRQLKLTVEQLSSRLVGGLLAPIEPPDSKMRRALLERWTQDENVRWPSDVLDTVARRSWGSVRDLEGLMARLRATLEAQPVPLKADEIDRLIGQWQNQTNTSAVSIDTILQCVAQHCDISVNEITGPTRTRPCTTARYLAIRALRELTTMSLSQIGGVFGGRDHTTIRYALQRLDRDLLRDRQLHDTLHGILNQFQRR